MVYREKLARDDLGSNVLSCSSSSSFWGSLLPLMGVDTSVQGQLM